MLNIDNYRKVWGFKDKSGILIIISGPSGVGKGTIVNEIIKIFNGDVVKSISVTTRKPRFNEKEGIDYFFKSIEEFSSLIEKDLLLEYACVFGGKLYGTPKDYVEQKLKEGKNVILEIDVQGALQVKRKFKDCVSIFVLPPNFLELEKRLRERKTEDEESIHNRLAIAHKELKSIYNYDYVIINDDLKYSIDCIRSIIIAEHCKINRNLKELNNDG
ncbi:MAG: guanylate kinase [Candidatus Sericytochromatia bacterium]|nr:MAG: guanylate kinase [Candidatus Sericytochromatia bacterium]